MKKDWSKQIQFPGLFFCTCSVGHGGVPLFLGWQMMMLISSLLVSPQNLAGMYGEQSGGGHS